MTTTQCRVWWVTEHDAGPAHLAWLDPDERARAGDTDTTARRLYVATHATARAAIATHLHVHPATLRFIRRCATCGGSHGKPTLVGGGIHFSITHTTSRGAVAVYPYSPLGIDLEDLNQRLDIDSVARGVLSARQRTTLARQPDETRQHALLAYWTHKEAVMKVYGGTLFDSRADRPPVRVRRLEAGDGYLAALAVAGRTMPPVVTADAAGLLNAWLQRQAQ